MNLATRLSLTHAVGAALTLAAVFAGYRYAYVPASQARALNAQLTERLEDVRGQIENLPTRTPPDLTATEATPAIARPIADVPPPMTPTVFLSTFEDHARKIGLRVEGSKELEDPGAAGRPPGKLVELTGTGSFSAILEFFEGVSEPLPGLEIRRLTLTRGANEQVRWTMVCKNHDGSAG